MATILIVDDHSGSRKMLMTLLRRQHHNLWEAKDGIEALALARNQHPDLLITDLLMPEMDGFELVKQLRTDPNTAPISVIFYTANYPQQESIALAHACGVQHFLPKPSEREVILNTVDAALHQKVAPVPVPSIDFDREHRRLLTNMLVHKVREMERVPVEQERAEPTEVKDVSSAGRNPGSPKRLTARQREVLQLIAEGNSTQSIARQLFVSVKTVETHRAHLMGRLNIHNVAGLVRYAIQEGLLTANP